MEDLILNKETLQNITAGVASGDGLIRKSDSVNTQFTRIEECCNGTTCKTFVTSEVQD